MAKAGGGGVGRRILDIGQIPNAVISGQCVVIGVYAVHMHRCRGWGSPRAGAGHAIQDTKQDTAPLPVVDPTPTELARSSNGDVRLMCHVPFGLVPWWLDFLPIGFVSSSQIAWKAKRHLLPEDQNFTMPLGFRLPAQDYGTS
jgi:hypothetical protein